MNDDIIDVDIMSVEYESYTRSYGKMPMDGVYCESLINMTNIKILVLGGIDLLSSSCRGRFVESSLEKSPELWQRHGQDFRPLFTGIDNAEGIKSRERPALRPLWCMEQTEVNFPISVSAGLTKLTKGEESQKDMLKRIGKGKIGVYESNIKISIVTSGGVKHG
ncbi:MAG: hypothetical protein N3D14_04140 [Aquificaceae bacterium]|nr:hypothetical protein [Aquificaceae bacterium]MCX8164564.1 hypothetical protein [Aquificaceae bacterium]